MGNGLMKGDWTSESGLRHRRRDGVVVYAPGRRSHCMVYRPSGREPEYLLGANGKIAKFKRAHEAMQAADRAWPMNNKGSP